jgi:hypothetical protein
MVTVQSQMKRGLKRLSAIAASVLIVCLPLTASIGVATAAAACAIPAPTGPGVHQPVGADAAAYTYDCNTGLYESSYYTFDPNTDTYTAIDPVVYTCDPTTNEYSYTTYVYSAAAAAYLPVTQTVSQPPAGATVVPCPTPNSAGGTAAATAVTPPGGSTTPTGSSNLDSTVNNNTTGTDTTNANVTNNVTSDGTSGDATVLGNTTAGDADSGDAEVVANELNYLQSTGSVEDGNQPATFVANIDGDVNGDFLLDPSTLGAVQPATVNNNETTTTNINNNANATMDNNVNLAADSGDASVENNTSAGSATSGNAEAVANIVNVIDSAITAGHSFVGVININGNLNGDILLPPDFVNELLADNVPTLTLTGPSSTNTSNTTANNNTTVTNTNNLGATNNITSDADSGSATVSNNTGAGSATTGSAANNITAFNLTGSNVVGANDLLVFVNVVGKWVGLIVNTPPGTTAASLGGGITENNTDTNNTNVNNTTNDQINNNVNVAADSGNADVADNTTAGDATSGNADTAVNLLNVEGSNISLSGWFGVLFINVFGTWNGSFGINTSAGDPTNTTPSASGIAATQFASFIPTPAGGSAGTTGGSAGGNKAGTTTVQLGNSTVQIPNSIASAVLAAHKSPSKAVPTPTLTPGHVNWFLVVGSTSLFVAYVVGDRLYDLRRR